VLPTLTVVVIGFVVGMIGCLRISSQLASNRTFQRRTEAMKRCVLSSSRSGPKRVSTNSTPAPRCCAVRGRRGRCCDSHVRGDMSPTSARKMGTTEGARGKVGRNLARGAAAGQGAYGEAAVACRAQGGDEEDLSFSQAATLDGNDGTDDTRKQGLDKPATRIRIVGKWANWGKSKGQGGCPPQSAAEDVRGNSPATPPALDAFMEEYFRFPSPTSLAAVGALPGASDADFQADAETRSVGARGRSQRGGLSAALAQRRVQIKMIGQTGITGEETDEPPRKRIKMVRRCGVCGKPGHDARTCEEAAESSESAICDVIVVRP
jgi:hypothetical protein